MPITPILQTVLSALGAVGLTVGTIVVGLWTFTKFFGQKIIEQRFAREADKFRHQHAQELETLKAHIS